jgi:hypothetical protein
MRTRMMKHNSQFQSSLAGVCGVLLMLCASQPGFAQQSAQPAAAHNVVAGAASTNASSAATPSTLQPLAPQASVEERETAAPAKPGSDGIKVHGHWKFEVHDPDGKLVSTREFENSLLTPSGGDWLLATLLLGKSVAADWGIALCPQAGGTWNNGSVAPNYYGLCTTVGPTPVAILVQSSTGPLGSELACGSSCVPGLQALLTGSPNLLNPIGISLSGSYTASQSVSINAVETATAFCSTDVNASNPANPPYSNVTPQTCLTLSSSNVDSGNSNLTFTPFTGTALAATQNLTAGQVLTVTVTISFS